MIKIIVFYKSKGIRILAPIIRDELKKIGYLARIIFAKNLDLIIGNKKDTFFVFTPHKFANFKRDGTNRDSKFIAFQQEQFSDKTPEGIRRINQFKPLIDKYDFIVDVSARNIKFLKEMGHKPEFILPTGYHHYLEFSKDIKTTQKKYECLFFGRYHDKPRRQKILAKLSKKFKFYPKYEGLYGANLKRAIYGSKIVLNIHQNMMKFPEYLRIMLAMANKRLVISEKINKIEPPELRDYMISAPVNKLADKIDYYLHHKDEYDKIVNGGYKYIKKNFRIDFYIKQFAKKILIKNNLH